MDDLQKWDVTETSKIIKKHCLKDVINLGMSGAPIIEIRDIVERAVSSRTALGWSGKWRGPTLLRERILETQKYDSIDVENLLVTHGTSGANFIAIMTLVEPGDEVIIEMPSWIQTYMACKYIAGVKVKVLNSKQENRWRPNFERLNELVSPKTKFLWFVNPCNPTGRVWKPKEMKEIVSIAKDNNLWILQDEIQRGNEWNMELAPSVANYYEKGISTGGLSKAIGATGLRIGWIACQDKQFIERCISLATYVTLTTNRIGEELAILALEPEKYRGLMAKGRSVGLANLKIMKNWITNRADLSWIPPEGSYCTFPKYRCELNSWDFCERALKEHRVVVGPGSGFLTEGHIRVCLGETTSVFIEGLRRLGLFLESTQREKN